MNQQEESEANHFAMCLLMPEHMVRDEITKLGDKIDLCNDRSVLVLARKFQVPINVMTFRLTQIYGLK